MNRETRLQKFPMSFLFVNIPRLPLVKTLTLQQPKTLQNPMESNKATNPIEGKKIVTEIDPATTEACSHSTTNNLQVLFSYKADGLVLRLSKFTVMKLGPLQKTILLGAIFIKVSEAFLYSATGERVF